MSLIDKAVLIDRLDELDNRARVKAVRDLIEEIPELAECIEPALPRTGKWESVKYIKCSACGGLWDNDGDEGPAYCPMCGAKMEER